jgi:hypothetical protein
MPMESIAESKPQWLPIYPPLAREKCVEHVYNQERVWKRGNREAISSRTQLRSDDVLSFMTSRHCSILRTIFSTPVHNTIPALQQTLSARVFHEALCIDRVSGYKKERKDEERGGTWLVRSEEVRTINIYKITHISL